MYFLFCCSPEVRAFLNLDNPRNAQDSVDNFDDSETMVRIHISFIEEFFLLILFGLIS